MCKRNGQKATMDDHAEETAVAFKKLTNRVFLVKIGINAIVNVSFYSCFLVIWSI